MDKTTQTELKEHLEILKGKGFYKTNLRLGNWQQMLNFILKYEPAYFNKLQLKQSYENSKSKKAA